MARFERWTDRLILLSLVTACTGLLLMMFHISLDIVLRYFFGVSLVGTIETVSYYYMIAVVFLPLAFVERKSEHIQVELFLQYCKLRTRNFAYIFGRLISIIFFSMLTYQSWQDAVRYTRIGEVPMGLDLPIWPSRWILPVSFALLVLALVLHTARAVVGLDAEKPQGDGPTYARDLDGAEGYVDE